MALADPGKILKGLALAAVLLCLALYGWTVWYERSLREADPHGYRNVETCPKIPRGATEADLVAALGAPEASAEARGVRRLSFHTLSAAATPIQAEVDSATGAVLLLRCAGEAEPRWVARP